PLLRRGPGPLRPPHLTDAGPRYRAAAPLEAAAGTGLHFRSAPGGTPGVTPAELLLVAVRWAHGMAAVACVGGSLCLLWVLERALRAADDADRLEAVRRAAYRGFRELADAAIVIFVVSGAVLTFDRLSSAAATPAYVVVLAIKIALALAMFYLSTRMRLAE